MGALLAFPAPRPPAARPPAETHLSADGRRVLAVAAARRGLSVDELCEQLLAAAASSPGMIAAILGDEQ